MFQPPPESGMSSMWDGNPVEFNAGVGYKCTKGLFFEMNRNLLQWNMTCLPDGSWKVPEVWPRCVASK